MPGTTGRGYRYPTNGDAPNVAVDIQNLATDVNTDVASVATTASGAVPKSTVTTKGDLIAATASATVARVGVGTDGQYLKADSAQATGLTWGNVEGLPSGSVLFVAQNTAPTGYLKANGALVSRTTYSALFSAIGTTFGVGDGSTTFALPDMRGYFPRGWADNGTIDSGRAFGSSQTATGFAAPSAGNAGTYTSSGQWPLLDNGEQSYTYAADRYFSSNGSSYTSGAQRVRPSNVALLAVIKF